MKDRAIISALLGAISCFDAGIRFRSTYCSADTENNSGLYSPQECCEPIQAGSFALASARLFLSAFHLFLLCTSDAIVYGTPDYTGYNEGKSKTAIRCLST